jgi:hypothetical protein
VKYWGQSFLEVISELTKGSRRYIIWQKYKLLNQYNFLNQRIASSVDTLLNTRQEKGERYEKPLSSCNDTGHAGHRIRRFFGPGDDRPRQSFVLQTAPDLRG